jgi:hypothetical protein
MLQRSDVDEKVSSEQMLNGLLVPEDSRVDSCKRAVQIGAGCTVGSWVLKQFIHLYHIKLNPYLG